MLSININQNIEFFHVLIHVIKHDMDPNSNVNYCRKIGPMTRLKLQVFFFLNIILGERCGVIELQVQFPCSSATQLLLRSLNSNPFEIFFCLPTPWFLFFSMAKVVHDSNSFQSGSLGILNQLAAANWDWPHEKTMGWNDFWRSIRSKDLSR